MFYAGPMYYKSPVLVVQHQGSGMYCWAAWNGDGGWIHGEELKLESAQEQVEKEMVEEGWRFLTPAQCNLR